MAKRLSAEIKEKITLLYDNGNGLDISKIAQQIGVSYQAIYSLTRIKQRTNPETGKLFESLTEYDDYHIRQRTNPKTRKLFASRTEYNDYHERQRTSRPENQELSDLIKKRLKELGRNQSWLAEEIEVTKQRVSQYVQGKSFPKEDVLQKLYSSLEVPYKTLEDFLDDRNTE